MFAHIIDSMAERERCDSEQRIPSQEGKKQGQDRNSGRGLLTTDKIVDSPPANSQDSSTTVKNIIHENIENTIHPNLDRLAQSHFQAKNWDLEIRKLSLGVSSSHLDMRSDSTFAQRLFSAFIANIGYPLSLNSFSFPGEKNAPGSLS